MHARHATNTFARNAQRLPSLSQNGLEPVDCALDDAVADLLQGITGDGSSGAFSEASDEPGTPSAPRTPRMPRTPRTPKQVSSEVVHALPQPEKRCSARYQRAKENRSRLAARYQW